MPERLAIFFDIGDTLASPRLTGGHLSGLDIYPLVPEVLHRLRSGGTTMSTLALGLMSNTDAEPATTLHRVLADSGLAALTDQNLWLFSSVEGVDKSQPAFFERGCERAGLPAERCIFVGENESERLVATSVGFRVSPHPLHALFLIENLPLD